MPLSTTQYGYIVDPFVPFTAPDGRTIRNGYVKVFIAGSSTPVITYANFDGATNQEKIELDNSGRVKHNVIGSKGSLYKVVVYDVHHSQETPILTVDKIAVLGASINATGATIVTGLDSVTVQEENFIKATVEGTSVELSLDPTEVTSELSTISAAETAAPDVVVPLLDKTGEGDSKKISLANLFKFALDWISRLAATITSFASGDFIAVSNPTDGTRKMSKDTLLQLTSQNALAGNVVQAFDPTRDVEHKYLAGESVSYEGKVYTFKVDHYGSWAAADVYAEPVIDIAKRQASCRPLDSTNFCWANLTINNSGWTDGGSPLGARIYVDDKHPIHLEAGDVLYVDTSRLKGYSYHLYTGIRKNGVYSHIGWSETLIYNADQPTDVVILFEILSEASFTGTIIDKFASSVCVSTKTGSVNKPYVIDEIENVKLRLGSYDFYGSGTKLVYQASSTRITPAEGHFVHFKAGDKIVATGYKIWLNRIDVLTNTYMSQYTVDSWYDSVVDIETDGIYLFIVRDISADGPADGIYFVRNGYKIVPASYSARTVKIDKNLLHLHFNLTINANQFPVVSYSSQRFCTFPDRPINVMKGDILVVNLDSSKTLGVYLQLVKKDGSTIERSWSYANYVVPDDGELNLVVEIKSSVSSSEYQGILEAAFSLSRDSALATMSMVARDPKLVKLPVSSKMFHQKEGIAHRGFSSVAPENTLPACRLAAERGFKWVECDVRYTADDVAVIIHDSTIDRTSNGSGAVSELTLAQLRTYDFGSWKSLDYAGTPIPTLEDFLMCCNRLGLNAVIDYSGNGSLLTFDHAKALVELISKCGMNGRAMLLLAGADRVVFERVTGYIISLGAYNAIKTSCLWDVPTDDDKKFVKYFRDMGYAVSMSIDYTGVSSSLMDFCAENDILVNVYTINSEAQMTNLADYGCVAWITSDTILSQDYIKTLELDKACTEL